MTPTVYFLSDYGLADEFVGVVHAVLRRLAPEVGVVDLTHQIPAFDVAAGAGALVRALPYLGAGALLAVVDPGVGGRRRPLALSTRAAGGGLWMVGPDNGVLAPAAEAAGLEAAFELQRPSRPGAAVTFDGRDLFAPAAAALCSGVPPSALGTPVDPAGLQRLVLPAPRRGSGDGRQLLQTEVRWIDHFGNVQLGVAADGYELPPTVTLRRAGGARGPGAAGDEPAAAHPAAGDGPTAGAAAGDGPTAGAAGTEVPLRLVRAFGDLGPAEMGLLADANGQLAVVAGRRSAAAELGLGPGEVVELVW